MQTESASPQPTPETTRELLSWLHTLIADINQRVKEHTRAVRVGPDASPSPSSPDATAEPSTEEMLAAFRQLESELSGARLEIEQQRRLIESYLHQAHTDTLTGVPNRRAFEEDLSSRLAQRKRYQVPVSLMLLDIDHFKALNDRHGHPAGDAALRWTAQAIAGAVREADVTARVGGEEFAVVLPSTNLNESQVPALRTGAAIAATPFVWEDAPIPLTVSIGLAEALAEETVEQLVARADEALYAAKNAGRNCVYRHDGNACEPVRREGRVAAPPKSPTAASAAHRTR